MLIFHKHECVYLANTKTGSTSIERTFGRYADFGSLNTPRAKHISYRKFCRWFPRFANTHEIVVCVRDPLDSLFSWYRYRQRDDEKTGDNSTADLSFPEFYEHWCKPNPPKFAKVSASVSFILDRDGNIPDISIFKYGASPTIHDYLQQKLGVTVTEKRVNVSAKPTGPTLADLRGELDLNHPKLVEAYGIFDRIKFVNA